MSQWHVDTMFGKTAYYNHDCRIPPSEHLVYLAITLIPANYILASNRLVG
jgi:hypothetical protein